MRVEGCLPVQLQQGDVAPEAVPLVILWVDEDLTDGHLPAEVGGLAELVVPQQDVVVFWIFRPVYRVLL